MFLVFCLSDLGECILCRIFGFCFLFCMKPIVKLSVRTRSQSRQGTPDLQEEGPNLDPLPEGEEGAVEQLAEQQWDDLEEEPHLDEELEESISAAELDPPTPENSVVSSGEEDEEGENEMAAEGRNLSITPGRFRGGVEENVQEYLTQFERVSRANGWDANKKKVILPCYLEGAALKWLENLEDSRGNELTWDEIVTGMKETFQGIAWDEQLEFKLRMRMQEENEAVEAYMQDVLNLCVKVDRDMQDSTKIKHILRGLKPSLLEKVMVMDNTTIADLHRNIRKLETARYMAGQRVDHLLSEAPTTTRAAAAGTAALEQKIEELTTQFGQLGMKLVEMERSRPAVRQVGFQKEDRRDRSEDRTRNYAERDRSPYPHWERGRGRGRGEGRGMSRGRTSDGRIICYKCNRPGHYAVACRANDQGNDRVDH